MTTGRRNMDSFDPDDMAIPELKLVQNVGAEYAKETLHAQPGQLFNTITDELYEELEVIVVDMKKTRTYWGRDEIGDEPPECSSDNALEGVNGQACKTCDHRHDAPWTLPQNVRRTKCLINYLIMAFEASTMMPLRIRATGISAQGARELVTSLRLNRELMGPEGIAYHKALVTISSVKKKSPSGDAYAYRFKIGSIVTDPERIETYLNFTNQLLSGGPELLAETETPEESPQLAPETTPVEPSPQMASEPPATPGTAPGNAPTEERTEGAEQGPDPLEEKPLDMDF